jgi:uncharacterized protein YjhX (UPF0386 family)
MISYPVGQSEFEIHAYLFCKLRVAKLDARGEVNWVTGLSKRGWKHCRCDIVIFKDKIPRLIIEVKRKKKDRSHSRQQGKYSIAGVPVLWCCGFSEIDALVDKCKDMIL